MFTITVSTTQNRNIMQQYRSYHEKKDDISVKSKILTYAGP